MIDELGVTEDRWLRTRPIAFPSGPTWLHGSTWYRGMVIKEQASPPGVFLKSPNSAEKTRLSGTSIDWDVGHEGPDHERLARLEREDPAAFCAEMGHSWAPVDPAGYRVCRTFPS